MLDQSHFPSGRSWQKTDEPTGSGRARRVLLGKTDAPPEWSQPLVRLSLRTPTIGWADEKLGRNSPTKYCRRQHLNDLQSIWHDLFQPH